MAYEPPHFPTVEEIRERATKLFMDEQVRLGLPAITPTEEELREGSYWEKARSELMSGIKSALESYLADLEREVDKTREELGIEKVVPEERITELEDKLSRLSERYKTTKTRLAEAREEIRRIKEKVPPPPPPPPPMGLSPEQKKRLEDSYRRVFEEAGITKIPMASFRDELALMQKELETTEREAAFRAARARIMSLARSLLPPPRPPVAPPPVAPPPRVEEAVLPAAAYLGPRTRVWEEFTCIKEDCWETVRLDRDLMNRVTMIPVAKAITPSGTVVEPLCRFPSRFYYMCPRHRKERYGYTGIYDYLAFALRDGEIGGRMCVTKATFRQIGLDDRDILEIEKEKVKYLPTYT